MVQKQVFTSTVTKTWALALSKILFAMPQISMWFAGVFFFAYFTTASLQFPVWQVRFFAYTLGIITALALAAIHLIDARLRTKGTKITVDLEGVSCTITGFSTTNLSIPRNKISSLYVTQHLIDKLLGLATVVITQDSGVLAIGGFPEDEVAQLSQFFAKIDLHKKG